MILTGEVDPPPFYGMIQKSQRQNAMTTATTFRFDATWVGTEGIESEILTIEAATLKEAVAAAALQINGSNSFADCLIDLQRIR